MLSTMKVLESHFRGSEDGVYGRYQGSSQNDLKATGRNRVRGLRLKSDLSHHHHVAMGNLKCHCPGPAPGNELARSRTMGNLYIIRCCPLPPAGLNKPPITQLSCWSGCLPLPEASPPLNFHRFPCNLFSSVSHPAPCLLTENTF